MERPALIMRHLTASVALGASIMLEPSIALAQAGALSPEDTVRVAIREAPFERPGKARASR